MCDMQQVGGVKIDTGTDSGESLERGTARLVSSVSSQLVSWRDPPFSSFLGSSI